MPRKLSNALTPLAVKNAKPGRHADGGGLHLLVKESGARSWVYRFMLNGKSRDVGLGAAGPGALSLADARDQASALRLKVKAGIDLALIPRTPLKLYAAYRRQGEGDYRAPYPHKADYARTPGIFAGTVWKTARIGVSGATMVSRDFELLGDAGVNRSVNRFHVDGLRDTNFEGRARIVWIPRWLIPFD